MRTDEVLAPPALFTFILYHFEPAAAAALQQAQRHFESLGFLFNQPNAKGPLSAPRLAELHTFDKPNDPPAIDELEDSDLSPSEKSRLARAAQATGVNIVVPPNEGTFLYREVLELGRALESAAPGVFWDSRCLVALGRRGWAERMAGWTADIPDVRRHIQLRAEEDGDALRFCTAGLTKFGLRELHVRHVAEEDADDAAVLMFLVAQTLVEQPTLERDGHLWIDAAAVKNDAARADLRAELRSGSRGCEVKLAVFPAPVSDEPRTQSAMLLFLASEIRSKRSLAVRRTLDLVLGPRPKARA